MSHVTLFLGLLLPWAAGVTSLMALPGKRQLSEPGELAWIAGAGYIVGAFMLTLWMRTLSLAGIEWGPFAIGAPLFALAAAAGYFVSRRTAHAWPADFRIAWRGVFFAPGSTPGARLAWRALLVWIALRFVLLGLEVSWQPLFPWNAWTQWATKGRVWFELGQIVPFVGSTDWFAADGTRYFDAGPNVPPTLPLLQVWSSIALGRWDDALMNWPWWQFAAALSLVVYGALRALGMAALAALVVTYFVSSVPLGNVHVALAGYADLPLAACYGCAALAFLRSNAARDWRDAMLAAALALACTQIKAPGIGWAATLIPGVIVALWPRRGVKIAAAIIAAIVFGVIVIARSSPTLFGHPVRLAYEPPWGTLAESYFLLGSWNLLWYGVVAAALLAWRDLLLPPLAPLTMIVVAAVTLLFILAAFPNLRLALGDQTSVNRASLQLAPLVIVFAALAFRSFALRCAGREAGGQAQIA